MRGWRTWLWMLSPGLLFPLARLSLKYVLSEFGVAEAAAWSCIALLPAVLAVSYKAGLLRSCPRPEKRSTVLWLFVTAALVILNRLLFLGAAPTVPLTLPALFAVLLCGPVSEELIYRGLLPDRCRGTLGAAGAVLLSAALFGAAHSGVPAMLWAGAVGLALSALREQTRGLAAPIAAHILLNLTALM